MGVRMKAMVRHDSRCIFVLEGYGYMGLRLYECIRIAGEWGVCRDLLCLGGHPLVFARLRRRIGFVHTYKIEPCLN